MPDIEKAIYWLSRAILKVMDMPEGYTRDNVIADINSATEAMKSDAQNGSTDRFYVEDNRGYVQYHGMTEAKYFDSLKEAHETISYWFDVRDRLNMPYCNIYNEDGDFIERVDRDQPEDDDAE